MKKQFEKIAFFHSKWINANEIDKLHLWFFKALGYFKKVYSFNDDYEISICVFDSVNDAQEAINRRLSETALVIPYADEQEALIICFSPALNTKNNDQNRMIRQFLHEICHIATSIEKGYTRELGNKENCLPTWLDEAIAEYYSSIVFDNTNKINDSIEYYKINDIPLDVDNLFDSYLTPKIKDINEYKYVLGMVSYYIRQNNVSVWKFEKTINELIRKFT